LFLTITSEIFSRSRHEGEGAALRLLRREAVGPETVILVLEGLLGRLGRLPGLDPAVLATLEEILLLEGALTVTGLFGGAVENFSAGTDSFSKSHCIFTLGAENFFDIED
jgi:hypothetical protein